MFTTSRKEGILNVNHNIILDPAKKIITVEGFGVFPISATKLERLSLAVARAEVSGAYEFAFTTTNTTLANFAANEPVTVGLTFRTTRRDSDYKSNGISEENVLILVVKPTASSVSALATAIKNELDALDYDVKKKYHIQTVVNTAGVLTITSDSPYYSVDFIEVNGPGGAKVSAFNSLNDGTGTSVIPVTGRGLPKQLEEQVKADSKGNTSHLRGIKNDMQINWNTTYAQLTIVNKDAGNGEYTNISTVNGVTGSIKEAVMYIDMAHDFITTWNTATTGGKDEIEGASGMTFVTDPSTTEEVAWSDDGGLIDYAS